MDGAGNFQRADGFPIHGCQPVWQFAVWIRYFGRLWCEAIPAAEPDEGSERRPHSAVFIRCRYQWYLLHQLHQRWAEHGFFRHAYGNEPYERFGGSFYPGRPKSQYVYRAWLVES